MKTRIVLVLLLIALVLLGTGAVAGSAPPRYRLEAGPLPGSLRFATAGVQARVVSAGGAYRLATGPAAGSVSGSAGGGCCCTWLPCVLYQK